MHTINFDEQTRTLTLRSEGLWDLAEVELYKSDLTKVMRDLKTRHQSWATLTDSRNQSLVTQEVAAALAEFLQDDSIKPTGKVAILVAQMLGKMQAERIADNPFVKVFLDEDEARAWLASSTEA